MPVQECDSKTQVVRENPDWTPHEKADPYRIEILTIEEEEGGYSTIALNLPGAGSCGENKDQSIANAKEAIKAVLESYKETGDPIPWAEVTSDKIVRGEYRVIWIHA